jgi:nicotinamide phosphoribosyltransferase
MNNLILMTDSYKPSHYLQYPEGIEYINGYAESRGGRWNRTVFFGLQMLLKEYFCKPITKEDIQEAREVWSVHGLPFNEEGWQYILDKHNGYLPLEISAVAEGTILPTENVLVQVTNTDPNCWWLPTYMETALLRAIWYPTTVATNSYICKQHILEALEKSGTPEQILFKLHDFGARGTSSPETAGIGGCAHLVNFLGSDTIEGILYARKYYNEPMAGFSIPAAEHSTITAWGGPEKEIDAFQNMIDKFGGKYPLFAVVSDSYDIYNAVYNLWGKELKKQVLNCGSTLVVRPDSGNPIAVVCSVINSLMQRFGYVINDKGYKVLPDQVRVIQGDGVNGQSIKDILFEMQNQKLSADNIAFGMGGALLQHFDRDTLKFAMKSSAIKRNGVWCDVFKDPITDPNKKSKKGILSLIKAETEVGTEYQTVRRDSLKEGTKDLLVPVFKNGVLLVDQSFSEIRERAQG